MITDTGIEAYTLDDLPGIQVSDFGIGIQFVEVGYTQSQECIRKELDGFCFRRSCQQDFHILLQGSFLQQSGKDLSFFGMTADNDTGRIQIIIESFSFTQELR